MKISLVEYDSGIDLDNDCFSSKSIYELKSLIDRANAVIKKSLKIKRESLVISEGRLRALGIAGIIRLSKDLELEIVPKMFKGSVERDWKETLFLLAALSKHGDIITTNHIHSNTAYKDSLYDIAGRILAREYSEQRRKLIRQYRKEKYVDYSIDGDIDFGRVFEKNPDGIPQSKISFDKINPYNSTIQSAMRIVLPYVKDSATSKIISRAIQELGKQLHCSKKRLRVPPRNKEWVNIYNLSFDIVSGMGSSLENGEIMSPGFIVDTWRIWEWLVTIAMKISLGGNYIVIPQAETEWGKKITAGKEYKVNVFPDVLIIDKTQPASPIFLMDAKYKTLPDEGNVEIDRADLYEAFAFCNATGSQRIFLVYPAPVSQGKSSGSVSCLTTYEISDVKISVIKVAFGALTKRGDISQFCHQMSSNVLDLL